MDFECPFSKRARSDRRARLQEEAASHDFVRCVVAMGVSHGPSSQPHEWSTFGGISRPDWLAFTTDVTASLFWMTSDPPSSVIQGSEFRMRAVPEVLDSRSLYSENHGNAIDNWCQKDRGGVSNASVRRVSVRAVAFGRIVNGSLHILETSERECFGALPPRSDTRFCLPSPSTARCVGHSAIDSHTNDDKLNNLNGFIQNNNNNCKHTILSSSPTVLLLLSFSHTCAQSQFGWLALDEPYIAGSRQQYETRSRFFDGECSQQQQQ